MWTAQGGLPKGVILVLSLEIQAKLAEVPQRQNDGHSNLGEQKYGQKFGGVRKHGLLPTNEGSLV